MFSDSNQKSIITDNHSVGRDKQVNFANLSAIKLTQQIARNREVRAEKTSSGILVRPTRLMKGIERADQVIDDLCQDAIKVEAVEL